MATKAPPSLHDLARVLPDFCLRHSIARLEVFGSVATGRTRADSDIDLMVTLEDTMFEDYSELTAQRPTKVGQFIDALEDLAGTKGTPRVRHSQEWFAVV